ncbi:MAG: GNAT family N-acetyltransferase [Thiobacillus sp.]|nr:GNAT family N-acetyltransferase [Thiobacillus sp.]
MTDFALIETDMARHGAGLAAIRRAVFIEEQGVPEALEWDEFDAVSTHWLAVLADGTPVGCARLLPDGHIGRMAVLPAWRGQGIGRALLDAALSGARARGFSVVRLSAQLHATNFYKRAGFVAEGEPYAEAGIPHLAMIKKLS